MIKPTECPNPECDEETCQECCPHDTLDHGTCQDCEAELSDELCNRAHEISEGMER
jgi:hypothetical protein